MRNLRAEGFVGFYGDALRPDLIESAGAENAAVLVIAIDDPDMAVGQKLSTNIGRQFTQNAVERYRLFSRLLKLNRLISVNVEGIPVDHDAGVNLFDCRG